MERKEFIKSCGYACLGGALLGSILEGCGGTKMISGTISGSDLSIPISSFLTKDASYRKFIIVQNEKLSFPICLYRFSDTEYSALFMKCTHQGAELQVFGDRLQCPAHGSEFSNRGIVENGPAETNLRTFPVTVLKDQLYISLR